MTAFNQNLGVQGLPGLGPLVEQESRKFLSDNTHLVYRGVRIDDASIDASHTGKTHILQGGLVLVRVEAAGANQGKYVPADHADAPVAADVEAAVILMQTLNMRDKTGTPEDKTASGIIHGFVNESEVIFGTAAPLYIDAIKAALPLIMWQS